jgi:glycosyltransferase involved in cell wall biosynthesis
MPDANWPLALAGNLRFAWESTKWLQVHGGGFDVIIGNGCNTWYSVDINVVHFVHSAWRQSTAHDAKHDWGPYGWYQWVYSQLNAHLEQRILPRAKTVVAVSEKVERELDAHGLTRGRSEVIHNGVDLDEFQPGPVDRSSLGLPPAVPLAFFAGDIRTPRKNLDTILQALVKVPSLHLAVAGSTDRSPFPALAERLGVGGRTHFLGFRRDVPDLMRAADLFVFPSRYEACSLVLLEAMASGLPIVTARSTGGAELIEDQFGIVLDESDNVDQLADALRRLVNDTDLRQRMGKRARSRAEELSWAGMAERYLEMMRDMVALEARV